MATRFIPLRVHSSYSLAEGAIKIPDLIARCLRNQTPAVALTDTSNLFGALEFSQAASKEGLQPIIGCQLQIAWPQEDPRRANTNSGPNGSDLHAQTDTLVLLAQTQAGYHGIVKLVTKAWAQAEALGGPQISLEQLSLHTEGIVALTGGSQGPVNRLLKHREPKAAEAYVSNLKDLYGDRLYMEITRQPFDASVETPLTELADRKDIPLVATNETFFLDEHMHAAHDALLCIADSAYVSQEDRRHSSPEYRLKSPKEMAKLFADLPDALRNTEVIARRCSFLLEPSAPLMPSYPTEKAEDQELKDQALEGLKARLDAQVFTEEMSSKARDDLSKIYHDRLMHELQIIQGMGFPGYFLIVADFIKWAKERGIPVGPGRGSGAGSLVAWSLTITDIDPIRFNLLFERFLNPERVSMPDFDVDFCQERRDEVIRYVCERYGANRVAHIITFGKLQARAVLRDSGRVLQMPYMQVDRLCKKIPNNPANPVTLEEALKQDTELQGEIKGDETVKRLFEIGKKLEGLYRHASTHAAGVVIGDRPLDDLIPLYYDPRSALPATQFSMKYVEQAGLVKFDFLGLKTLTIIARCVELVRTRGEDIDILKVSLEDPATFALLNRVETVGLFQMEGGGMSDVLRQLKPSEFEDLIALVALYRPGPMDDIPRYIACKHGTEKVSYLHPMLEDILKPTYGVMVYQEQVMQIAQVMGGYSLGHADLLRRAMGKKIKSEMDAQRNQFVEGATKKGVKPTIASQIFDQMAKFAGYGFNKSHAAPYALITYQTAYLKANYPVEFFAASMTLDMGNTDKLNVYRQELQRMAVPLLPPDINASFASFAVEDIKEGKKGVRYALAAVKNVGEAAMENVTRVRTEGGPFKDIWDFATRVDPKSINKRLMENLILAGAFDGLNPNRAQLMAGLEPILRTAALAHAEKNSSQASLFGEATKSTLPTLKLPSVKPWGALEKLNKEFEAVGFYLSAHPLDAYQEALSRLKVTPSHELPAIQEAGENRTLNLAGVVVNKQARISRNGQKFAFVQITDRTGVFEVTLFSEQLSQFGELMTPGQQVYLEALARVDGDNLRLTIQSVASLDAVFSKIKSTMRFALQNASALEALKGVLAEAPAGKGKVVFDIATPTTHIEVSLARGIHFTSDLRSHLYTLPGIESIREE